MRLKLKAEVIHYLNCDTTATKKLPAALVQSIHYKVKKLDEKEWSVSKIFDETKNYKVKLTKEGFTCECKDYNIRKVLCKHILLVIIGSDLPEEAIYLFVQWPELSQLFSISN